MKLLFDQNLPPRLVWAPRAEGYPVVTKDADFAELALRGDPPLKVVWLRLGNCTTSKLDDVLRRSRGVVQQLSDDADARVLSVE